MYPLILQFIGLAATLWIAYLAQPGSSLFSWHPTLMALSFLVLMPNGIFAYSRAHPFYGYMPRTRKSLIHNVSQGAAVVCALLGLALMITNKDQNGASHFTTRHGLFGLITCVCMAGASMGGFFAYNNKLVKAFIKPAAMKSIHAFFGGSLVYPLAMATIVMATYSNWLVAVLPAAYMRYSLAAVPVVLGVSVYVQLTQRAEARSA